MDLGMSDETLRTHHKLIRLQRHAITSAPRRALMYTNCHDLVQGYLEEHLKGKPSYSSQRSTALQWLLTLVAMPTRKDILARHKLKGRGHFEKGCSQANTELALLRAAIRWGLYHETWEGSDPTVGVTKWKTKKRRRVSKHEEILRLQAYFETAETAEAIRNRAMFGLMFFAGCRQIEARTALLTSITPYGEMGCWNKGETKNGEEYEVPLPKQYMAWLAAWKAIRPSARPNPYLFPGREFESCLTADMVDHLWHDLRLTVNLPGLWNYDLRRSLATHMSNELKIDSAVIDAILGHENTGSLGHYLHVSFDAMTGPIQHYADWLCGLQEDGRV